MKKLKSSLQIDIEKFLQINEICFLEMNSKSLPKFMVIIEGKIIWIELNKNTKINDFSHEMIDNGCAYLTVDNFEQFKKIFTTYIRMEEYEQSTTRRHTWAS